MVCVPAAIRAAAAPAMAMRTHLARPTLPTLSEYGFMLRAYLLHVYVFACVRARVCGRVRGRDSSGGGLQPW